MDSRRQRRGSRRSGPTSADQTPNRLQEVAWAEQPRLIYFAFVGAQGCLRAMASTQDTIAALATPTGTAAIAVLRISGPDTARITREIAGSLPPLHAVRSERIITMPPITCSTISCSLFTRDPLPTRARTSSKFLPTVIRISHNACWKI